MAVTKSALSKSANERLEKQRIDQRYRTARTLFRVGGVVICFWLVGEAIRAFAGKDTNIVVSLLLSIFADFKFAASIALAGTAAGWAIVERWLRHNKVEYLQERIRKLERNIDPRRSTSNLTTRGQTNPSDRD
jgi:hypothetical protein